ncbi:MAG: glycosyltransferase family 39 protein [Gemmatimonadales bacterium]
MSSESTGRRQGPAPAVILAALIVLAVALRAFRLGDWNFEATEMFTLRDSNDPRLGNPRPLIYFLNYFLIRTWMPLDELGLRILPALFGVLGVPALYLMGRRLVGTRAALFAALLLTFSSFHVYYSQFARYWSLVFLLCAVYPYAIYLGIRERDRRALIFGVLTGVLAILAHPVSVLLVGGVGLWVLATYLRRDQLARLWSQKAVRWGTGAFLIVSAGIAIRYIPLLQSWVADRDQGKGGQFLLHLPGGPGAKQLSILLSYVDTLTLPMVLTGLVGLCLLWQQRDRPLALFLTCLFVFPVAFLMLVSFRTAISTIYLLPSVPVFFYGAGVFLDRLSAVDLGLRPRWLLPATVTLLIIVSGVPTLISQYRDGRRWDFRGIAGWLDERLAPGDAIFSDQPQVLAHYLPGQTVQRLGGDPAPLMQAMPGAGPGALWIVAPAPSHAFRTSPKLAKLKVWMYENCQLRNTVGAGRLDFRQHYLEIYRCPPAARVSATSP